MNFKEAVEILQQNPTLHDSYDWVSVSSITPKVAEFIKHGNRNYRISLPWITLTKEQQKALQFLWRTTRRAKFLAWINLQQ